MGGLPSHMHIKAPMITRFVLLGFSANLRVLVVVHCYRRSGSAIRLISARKATREERRFYPQVCP
ncbi:BrnT family toxin [uncultured Nitrosomonas sp.]|uniref:BrnT family toxin n=1 Tax=uncultured Nitrosomonas sp. TaxID=156424 RepID=UPI00345D7E8B